MTVNELIQVLTKMPQDAPVEIVDAETGWSIVDIQIGTDHKIMSSIERPTGTVFLWGDYSDMVQE